AVRDDAIRPLAEALAGGGAIGREHVVLHLSGVQGQEALAPLVPSHAALGSIHPLQTISDPERAPERLRSAWAAVEGMPRAVEAAEAIARGDRKSTRLNSSHGSISYAVFCLKKKNKKIER